MKADCIRCRYYYKEDQICLRPLQGQDYIPLDENQNHYEFYCPVFEPRMPKTVRYLYDRLKEKRD
jgi:hypothetical protein